MKSPTDKSNDIIQIFVTRACTLKCSNCTPLLEFRRDPPHMSVDCFRNALRSLDGWYGVRAMFGGCPTLNPRFLDMCDILREEVPEQRHRGLWVNDLINDEIGQACRDTFYPHGRLNLNAHNNVKATALFDKWLPGKMIDTSRPGRTVAWHGPILMSHKDFGISESEWVQKRESCQINTDWSALIREVDGKPYAWFCEVASALDAVRGENHGVEAVPGWWRWKMDKFQHQVSQCCDRGCGVPLRLLGHQDQAETHDCSASFKDIVELTIQRKPKTKVQFHDTLPVSTECVTDYEGHRTHKPVTV